MSDISKLVKQQADTYVAKLKLTREPAHAERWFPPHKDTTVNQVRQYHQKMSKLWQAASRDHA
jgi:carboxylesterase type B